MRGSRALSQTCQRWQDDNSKSSKPKSRALLENLYGTPQEPKAQPNEPNTMSQLSQSTIFKAMNTSKVDTSALSGQAPLERSKEDMEEPYHLHIYSHKHNTHVTCTKPNREPIISLSCGNLGFRKSRRGTFDSAYSLTKYLIERLIHNGWPMKIKRLEVVMRGFGQGREAALKVLMSPEGQVLREKIVRVSDSTRLKFGGTRSRAPRRL
ncbi:hypothetical protein ACO1O0_000191 [Amphichorda felina]